MSSATVSPAPALSEAEIRERAYYLWLEHGCPADHDEAIWHAARSLLHDRATPPPLAHVQAVAARAGDPQHHFHPPATPGDRRHGVADSGRVQRHRARAQKNG